MQYWGMILKRLFLARHGCIFVFSVGGGGGGILGFVTECDQCDFRGVSLSIITVPREVKERTSLITRRFRVVLVPINPCGHTRQLIAKSIS